MCVMSTRMCVMSTRIIYTTSWYNCWPNRACRLLIEKHDMYISMILNNDDIVIDNGDCKASHSPGNIRLFNTVMLFLYILCSSLAVLLIRVSPLPVVTSNSNARHDCIMIRCIVITKPQRFKHALIKRIALSNALRLIGYLKRVFEFSRICKIIY